MKRRKANQTGHILHWNCLLQHVIEGKIEGRIKVTVRWGKRHKQLLDDTNGKTGYWILEEAALDGTLWRVCFGRGCGPVIRQTTETMITNIPNLSFPTFNNISLFVCIFFPHYMPKDSFIQSLVQISSALTLFDPLNHCGKITHHLF